jgi:hypothetical protein
LSAYGNLTVNPGMWTAPTIANVSAFSANTAAPDGPTSPLPFAPATTDRFTPTNPTTLPSPINNRKAAPPAAADDDDDAQSLLDTGWLFNPIDSYGLDITGSVSNILIGNDLHLGGRDENLLIGGIHAERNRDANDSPNAAANVDQVAGLLSTLEQWMAGQGPTIQPDTLFGHMEKAPAGSIEDTVGADNTGSPDSSAE